MKTVQIEHMDEDTWARIKAGAALHRLTIPEYLRHLQGDHRLTPAQKGMEVKP